MSYYRVPVKDRDCRKCSNGPDLRSYCFDCDMRTGYYKFYPKEGMREITREDVLRKFCEKCEHCGEENELCKKYLDGCEYYDFFRITVENLFKMRDLGVNLKELFDIVSFAGIIEEQDFDYFMDCMRKRIGMTEYKHEEDSQVE